MPEIMPAVMKQAALATEIMNKTEIPSSDRSQHMLESMQERMNFFASLKGGIQFDYDSVSRLVQCH